MKDTNEFKLTEKGCDVVGGGRVVNALPSYSDDQSSNAVKVSSLHSLKQFVKNEKGPGC